MTAARRHRILATCAPAASAPWMTWALSAWTTTVTPLVVVTDFKATRARKLTLAAKEADRVLAAGRAPVERGFAHRKNWRILTKLRTDPARATHLLRALLLLANIEATTGKWSLPQAAHDQHKHPEQRH